MIFSYENRLRETAMAWDVSISNLRGIQKLFLNINNFRIHRVIITGNQPHYPVSVLTLVIVSVSKVIKNHRYLWIALTGSGSCSTVVTVIFNYMVLIEILYYINDKPTLQ